MGIVSGLAFPVDIDETPCGSYIALSTIWRREILNYDEVADLLELDYQLLPLVNLLLNPDRRLALCFFALKQVQTC